MMKRFGILLGVMLVGAPAQADMIMLTGVSAPEGASAGYVPPTLVNQFALALGDSRTQNNGGVGAGNVGTANYQVTDGFGHGYAGWLYPLSGNKVIAEDSWNYGVGAQTTSGIAGRTSNIGVDCNWYSQTSALSTCLTGAQTTVAAATSTNASQIPLTATTGISVGDFVSISQTSTTGPLVNPPDATVTGVLLAASCTLNTHPCVNISINTTNSINNGANAVFSHPSLASSFTTYDPNDSAKQVDIQNNIINQGVYSAVTDPAQVVFLVAGTNDSPLGNGAGGVPQSIINLQAIFTKLGPSGANKIVIVGDEMPKGLATGYSTGGSGATGYGAPETGTIPSSATCNSGTPANCIYQVVNHAAFFDEASEGQSPLEVFYVGAGTGGAGNAYVPVANDGVNLTYCNAACLAGNGGSPPSGDFSVTGYTANFVGGTSGSSTTTVTVSSVTNGTIAVGNSLNGYAGVTVSSCSPNCSSPTSITTNIVVNIPGTSALLSTSSAATGTYLVNYADAGKKIGIYYRWANNASGTYLVTIHNWLDSTSCGSFLDSAMDGGSGNTYAVSGAQCPGLYPWVHVASTWASNLDANAPVGSPVPGPFVSDDGLHQTVYAGALASNAMLTTAGAASAIQSTAPYPLPASSVAAVPISAGFSWASGTQTACTGQGPGGAGNGGGQTSKAYFLTSSLTPAVSSGLYQLGMYFSPGPSTTGIPRGATIVCLDGTDNAIQLSAPATAQVSLATTSFFSTDPTTFVSTGVMSTANAALYNTSPTLTGCTATTCPITPGATVKAIPAGAWTIALGSGYQTSVAAGTTGFTWGMEHNPFSDGFDDFVFTLQGQSPAGSDTVTLTYTIPAGIYSTYAASDLHRAQCEIKISAGPNGHLYGVTSVSTSIKDVSNTTYLPPGVVNPGASATWTNWTASVGGGSSEYSDASIGTAGSGVATPPNVSGGVLTIPELTPPSNVYAGSAAQASMFITALAQAGDPVSATVRIRRCWAGKTAG